MDQCLQNCVSNCFCNNKNTEVDLSISNLEFAKFLAKGSYSRVYLLKLIEKPNDFTDQFVCKICDLKDGFIGSFLREISILKNLSQFKHKNIITLSKIIIEAKGPNTIGLVMPYVKNTLHNVIEGNNFSFNRIKFIITELVSGIDFIHKRGIIHRDIKPANILIDNNEIKICDFNLAKCYDHKHQRGSHTLEVVTTPYRAPEVWRNQRYSFPIDMWSVGVILLELIRKQFIFRTFNVNKNNTVYILKLLKEYRIDRFYGLLAQLLDMNPNTRITSEKCLRYPLINGKILNVPAVPRVVEIISNELSKSLDKFKATKEITISLAGNIMRVTKCSPDHAALIAIKMCEDDIYESLNDEDFLKEEINILNKMNYNLIISGNSEYFKDDK